MQGLRYLLPIAALVGALALASSAFADAAVQMTEGSQADINSWAFTPPEVTISAGQAITWTNSGTIAHTATATDGTFDTGQLAPGESKTITLNTPGNFAYTCQPHPWMKGTVTVHAAAAQAQPTPTAFRPAATPTPFRFVPSTTSTGATTTTTTTAPRAGGIPLELAAPLLAAGASAFGGGALLLRRGRRRE